MSHLRRREPVLVAACLGLAVLLLPCLGRAGDDAPKDKPPDTVENSVGMKLVQIPAGKFMMGSPPGEAGRSANEGPQHVVEISRPFQLANCPVTRAQFADFLRAANYLTDAEKANARHTWFDPGFEQTDDDPVVQVSWNDAAAYCDWLSRKEKKTYVLPTESQWEYACRAGTMTAYSFGDDPADLVDFGWYARNSNGRTHPVGTKKPNPWGLYDVHGNVRQWCADWFGPYPEEPTKDPEGPAAGKGRVLRGGSFFHPAAQCRSAFRTSAAPNCHYDCIGFRVSVLADSK